MTVEAERHARTEVREPATVRAAKAVLEGSSRKRLLGRMMPFLGPAFVASVAYVDPGNYATNIEAGAKYGYVLLWVIVASNLMAMLIQSLSAKLGIATGRNLAQLCRDRFPRPVVWSMWAISELVAMATDLAEFLGAALGFALLFNIPLLIGALLTAVTTMLVLALERYGFRPLEAVITAMLGVIALCYVLEAFMYQPEWGLLLHHATVPSFPDTNAVMLAAGILGATVMPHVIFLHSALTQGRIVTRDEQQLRRLYHFELADVIVAMGVAGLVNAGMLIMAAATFYHSGLSHIASIEEAHATLAPLLGEASSWIFAVSLLASGLSSSAVGTMSGQVIMDGFLHRKIPIVVRRLVTMVPALAVIALGLDPTRTLVISQVVLSFGIPFALIPLILFTRDADLMGGLKNRTITTAAAALAALLIISLNLFLIYRTLAGE